MAIPHTKSGKNMYDMLSLLQKAIRRGKYREAAYAANELESTFRKVLWSRILVITAEDCYGVITKEVMQLKKKDDFRNDNELIGQAIAIMCKALKSRDACYFSCNFVLDSRQPRKLKISEEELKPYNEQFGLEYEEYDDCGFKQISLFDKEDKKVCSPNPMDVAILHKAIDHLDMDIIGYQANAMRVERRELLWEAIRYYASEKSSDNILDEIIALEEADAYVNRNRKNGEKDEIFISKALTMLCYDRDESIDDVKSSEVISLDSYIDWSQYKVKPIDECYIPEIPEWTFDCHTLRGKRAGKTDWDMTVDEQAALYPKKYAYFDNASWLYTYEQDVRNGVLDEKGFEPILEFSKTHEVNPVKFIPYVEDEVC